MVRVEWVDSSSDNGRWTHPEEIDNDILEAVSCGFLVKETDKQITLALSCITTPEQEQYCQMLSIPKVAITKFEDICLEIQ